MVIANPIYDVVFKRMMENERVAKFFIGTLLEETIEAVEVKPQEYTYEGEFDFNNPKHVEQYEARVRERHSIWVYRLDFIATIKTESGELKKVLIEIQKAKNQIDLMRFRNYLAEQYKKEDVVNNKKVALPITTIYILGFILPEIETACLKVERNYLDLTNKTILKTKSDFVEKLTHDSFIVQVERITSNYKTKLDKLLSIFEQSNFVDDKKIIKEFTHLVDLEEVKIATDILHYSGTNPTEKRKIENEQEAIRTINALFEDEIWFFEQAKKKFEEDKKQFEKTVSENEKALSEKEKALSEKDVSLALLQKEIEELKNKLDKK